MTTQTTGAAELPEALPRYREYMHLRTTGAWSSGVPAWARDYSGCMNDMTAAHAVIEELHAQVEALSAAQAGAPVIPAMMYLMLTDAMGYDSGEDGTTWSPEEWAAHLYAFYESHRDAPKPDTAYAAQEDAARYRWLREQSFDTWKLIAWNTWNNDPAVWPDRDAAIDAARKQGEKQ